MSPGVRVKNEDWKIPDMEQETENGKGTTGLAFELLRIAIGTRTENRLSLTPSEEEWRDIHSFAEQQAIIGVLFHGVELLPAEQRPPRDLLMDWFGQTECLRHQNEVLNVACKRWSERFAKYGFHTCILKGQSNVCLYPGGMVRTPGDVDILVTDTQAEDFYESRHRIIHFMRGIYPKCTVQYHHIELPHADDISVEVHYTPVVAFEYFTNRRLQHYLWIRRMGCYPGTWGFNHLDREADLIFQMYHIFKHLIIEGVGMRQIIDYYLLLKGSTPEVRQAVAGRLRTFGLFRFAGALMYVLQKHLGLQEEYLLVPPDVKRGHYLMEEILTGGNFGRYDERFEKQVGGRIHNFWMIFRLAMRSFRYFPLESILSPIGRAVSILWLKRYGYYVAH